MTEVEYGPDYEPAVDSARIRDSTPREMGSRLSEEYVQPDDYLKQAMYEKDPSKRESIPVPGLEEIGGRDFMAHVAAMQDIESDVPVPGRLDRWSDAVWNYGDRGSDFELGLQKYVSSVYTGNVGFDPESDISLDSFDEDDGEVTLSVDLHYEPDAVFVKRVELPGELQVFGDVEVPAEDEVDIPGRVRGKWG